MSGGLSLLRDIGAYIKQTFAGYADVVAAGSGDDTEVDGPWTDRLGFDSLVASIAWQTTLTDLKTLSIAMNLQDADTDAGVGAGDFGTALASTVQVTSAGGGVEVGVTSLDFDLSDAKRYVRLQFTPDLDAASADLADLIGQLILGGAQEVPAA